MSIARHHCEWLSLVPVSFPFLRVERQFDRLVQNGQLKQVYR